MLHTLIDISKLDTFFFCTFTEYQPALIHLCFYKDKSL